MLMYNIRLDLTRIRRIFTVNSFCAVPRKAVAMKSLTSVRNWNSCSCSGSEPNRFPESKLCGLNIKGVILWWTIQHDLQWFTVIYIDLHWFTLIYIDLHWFTLIYIDLHWFTLIYIDLHWFTLIYIDLHWFTLIYIDLHWFTLIYIDLHWFTLIYIDLHWFTLIYIDLHWFTIGLGWHGMSTDQSCGGSKKQLSQALVIFEPNFDDFVEKTKETASATNAARSLSSSLEEAKLQLESSEQQKLLLRERCVAAASNSFSGGFHKWGHPQMSSVSFWIDEI